MVLVFPNDDVDGTDHHQGDEESFIEITLYNITIYLYSGQDGRDHCSVDEV